MKLIELNRKFLSESARSIIDHSLPIKPVQNLDIPLIVVEKWKIIENGRMSKKYIFESTNDRNRFVTSLLNYEQEKGHHAKMLISTKEVTIELITHDVEKITEFDKAYAKYADIIRKDIAYNSTHE